MGEPVKTLTIGGSDSGGAAGIQADLKTFTALGAYGMSVLTAVTAQNSVEVAAVHPLPLSFILRQLEVVLDDYGAGAIKTGFLGSEQLPPALAEALAPHLSTPARPWLVVDPVLVNHRREALFPPAVARAYLTHLFPLADLVTPNWAEAALLAGRPVTNGTELQAAARQLQQAGARHVLVTGWREEGEIVDLLLTPGEQRVWRSPYLDTANTHGSGDTLSAAIAVLLAQGKALPEAIAHARRFTRSALASARSWRLGHGHGPLNHLWGRELPDIPGP